MLIFLLNENVSLISSNFIENIFINVDLEQARKRAGNFYL